MGAKRLTTTFLSNTFEAATSWQFYAEVTGYTYFTQIIRFRNTPTASFDVQIGVDIAETLTNLKTKIDSYILAAGVNSVITTEISGSDFIVYAGTNTLDATLCSFLLDEYDEETTEFCGVIYTGCCAISGSADNYEILVEDYEFETPAEDIVIENTNNLTSERIIFSRSPYFFNITPGVVFDQVLYEIRIWKGNKTINKPVDPTFQLSKLVVIAGQPTISINISNLINNYVKNTILQSFGEQDAYTVSINDTVWCEVIADVRFNTDHLFNVTQTFFAVDGFGYHVELANPDITKRFLSTTDKHFIYRGADYPLYFLTKDLVSITVDGDSVPFTYGQDESSQLIGFINVGDFAETLDSFDVVLDYGIEITIPFEVKDECRFMPVNCFFKNRFGFWQSIPFNKQNKRSLSLDNKDYIGLQSNFGDYSLMAHHKRTFLHEVKEQITVNTDFLPEWFNDLFTELMLSEFIYLEENGVYLPVNLNKKSFEKKTKLTNKLIQYSMDFEYSFNIMNTVV